MGGYRLCRRCEHYRDMVTPNFPNEKVRAAVTAEIGPASSFKTRTSLLTSMSDETPKPETAPAPAPKASKESKPKSRKTTVKGHAPKAKAPIRKTAKKRLAPHERGVVVVRKVHALRKKGMTQAEIARKLKMPAGTVNGMLHHDYYLALLKPNERAK